jgi:hypothetical protein
MLMLQQTTTAAAGNKRIPPRRKKETRSLAQIPFLLLLHVVVVKGDERRVGPMAIMAKMDHHSLGGEAKNE